MIPPKLIVALVVTALLTALVILGGQHYSALRAKAALADQRDTTLSTTSGVIADGSQADAHKVKLELDVSGAQAQFNQSLQEAKRNEPETRSRADRSVPDSVRRAYRERRLARERSGRGESEPRAAPRSEDAVER